MNYEHDHLATPAEACREFARNVGADRPESAWILTDFDTWERNPFYSGPAVPHPEDEPNDDDVSAQWAAETKRQMLGQEASERIEAYKALHDEIPF